MACLLVVWALIVPPAHGTPAAEPGDLPALYGKLPLGFEANRGQSDPSVRFLSHGSGYTLFLTESGPVFVLSRRATRPGGAKVEQPVILRMQLVGGKQHPRVTGSEKLPGRASYLRGSDPSGWRTNIPTYARVRYEDVYPGVDVEYHGRQGRLEFDFLISPGADPSRIELKFEGASRLETGDAGDLLVRSRVGTLRFGDLLAYQETAGERRAVLSRYAVSGHHVRLRLGSYDRASPLTVDPVLDYSTYLGSRGGEFGLGMAVDRAGNAYVVGETTSSDYPTTSRAFDPSYNGGEEDAFVTKLNRSGTALVYSTYLGGSSHDTGLDVEVDQSGAAYVVGQTFSSDFPLRNAYQPVRRGHDADAFVTKLGPKGSDLVFSTYLGGSHFDSAIAVAVDRGRHVYVAGSTMSSDFPVMSGAPDRKHGGGECGPGRDPCPDAYVVKLARSGSTLAYSTYLGGRGYDQAVGLAVDRAGSAYIAGETWSPDFPTTRGAYDRTLGGYQDAFVTRLNARGQAWVYSTYLGGHHDDAASGIALDRLGHAYVAGLTDAADFPTRHAYQPAKGGDADAFVTKLNVAGSGLVYSTFLGGKHGDLAMDVAVDRAGAAYVTGDTSSSDFPTTKGAPDRSYNGGWVDVFVTKIGTDGATLRYSTYLGGSRDEFSRRIAVGPTGDAYVVGSTHSADFPTTRGAYDRSYGQEDAFVIRIGSRPTPTAGRVGSLRASGAEAMRVIRLQRGPALYNVGQR